MSVRLPVLPDPAPAEGYDVGFRKKDGMNPDGLMPVHHPLTVAKPSACPVPDRQEADKENGGNADYLISLRLATTFATRP